MVESGLRGAWPREARDGALGGGPVRTCWMSILQTRTRGVAALALALGGALGAFVEQTAKAEGQESPVASAKFESSPALYAAGELGHGGLPLYQALFPSGWPTTRDYRKLTLEAGSGAFADNVGAILGSGLGVPLSVSDGERSRLKDLQAGSAQAPGTVSAMLKARFEAFKALSDLKAPIDDKFMPVFLPFRRGEPVVSAFDESRPSTWTWSSKSTEATVTLDSVGLAIYANTLLAEQQLGIDRKVDLGQGPSTFVGRSDVEGFVAFCALNCAVDAMNELRTKLCINMKSPEHPQLEPYPKDYRTESEYNRRFFFPHLVTPKVQPASVQYEPGASEEAKKSLLWDQAALLLGVCELAHASDMKTGAGRFFSNDAKTGFFDPNTTNSATELAVFIYQSMVALNCNSKGQASSVADIQDFGKVLYTQDAGLLLLALESFLQLNAKSTTVAALQTRARGLTERVSKFLVTVQKTSPVSPGYCDAFNLESETKTNSNASLAAQGLAIRGLIAARRAFALPGWTAGTRPDVLNAAQRTVEYLEKSRWDAERRAYLDSPGARGAQKLSGFDAIALLGGLRDLALDQKDVRYLLRYKSYMTTLRANGFELSGSTRQGDGSDGVKKTAVVGLAPATALEISIP